MISFLNDKYGSGTKTFIEILEIFRNDPFKIMLVPHSTVKKLI